jgi:pyochelin biosynthetic protein PchC
VSLFCFPHAGGGATSFLRLATALTPEIEVFAVQYPGRQDRFGEPFATSLTELAATVAAEVRRVAAGPFALFGHSMGATVAFETARRLEGDGLTPVALFASGRTGPSYPPGDLTGPLDDAALLADIRLLGGTPEEVLQDPGMMSILLPPLRADYRALQSYRFATDVYRERVACRITALVGNRDPRVSKDGALAWSRHTAAEFELLEFAGGHFYLDGSTDSVADHIRTVLRDGVRV